MFLHYFSNLNQSEKKIKMPIASFSNGWFPKKNNGKLNEITGF